MKVLAQDKEEILILCDVKYQTSNVYMILDDDGDKVWLPKSQVEVVDVISDMEYELSMPRWLAEEKEIV